MQGRAPGLFRGTVASFQADVKRTGFWETTVRLFASWTGTTGSSTSSVIAIPENPWEVMERTSGGGSQSREEFGIQRYQHCCNCARVIRLGSHDCPFCGKAAAGKL